MSYQNIFKRYEIKYIITKEQSAELKKLMKDYMKADKFGKSVICNIYYDTPDYLLVRRSNDKPEYKEKLRARSYGVASSDSTVFVELKKKYDGIVYKRRINLKESEAQRFLNDRTESPNSQIAREIDYCFERYPHLQPKVFLSYKRQAFYSRTDDSFRMTFDENILWRDYDVSLCSGIYGKEVLDRNKVLLEVKTAGAIPLWLVDFFSENKIYKTSFSKYGTAYRQILQRSPQLSLTEEPNFILHHIAERQAV